MQWCATHSPLSHSSCMSCVNIILSDGVLMEGNQSVPGSLACSGSQVGQAQALLLMGAVVVSQRCCVESKREAGSAHTES